MVRGTVVLLAAALLLLASAWPLRSVSGQLYLPLLSADGGCQQAYDFALDQTAGITYLSCSNGVHKLDGAVQSKVMPTTPAGGCQPLPLAGGIAVSPVNAKLVTLCKVDDATSLITVWDSASPTTVSTLTGRPFCQRTIGIDFLKSGKMLIACAGDTDSDALISVSPTTGATDKVSILSTVQCPNIGGFTLDRTTGYVYAICNSVLLRVNLNVSPFRSKNLVDGNLCEGLNSVKVDELRQVVYVTCFTSYSVLSIDVRVPSAIQISQLLTDTQSTWLAIDQPTGRLFVSTIFGVVMVGQNATGTVVAQTVLTEFQCQPTINSFGWAPVAANNYGTPGTMLMDSLGTGRLFVSCLAGPMTISLFDGLESPVPLPTMPTCAAAPMNGTTGAPLASYVPPRMLINPAGLMFVACFISFDDPTVPRFIDARNPLRMVVYRVDGTTVTLLASQTTPGFFGSLPSARYGPTGMYISPQNSDLIVTTTGGSIVSIPTSGSPTTVLLQPQTTCQTIYASAQTAAGDFLIFCATDSITKQFVLLTSLGVATPLGDGFSPACATPEQVTIVFADDNGGNTAFFAVCPAAPILQVSTAGVFSPLTIAASYIAGTHNGIVYVLSSSSAKSFTVTSTGSFSSSYEDPGCAGDVSKLSLSPTGIRLDYICAGVAKYTMVASPGTGTTTSEICGASNGLSLLAPIRSDSSHTSPDGPNFAICSAPTYYKTIGLDGGFTPPSDTTFVYGQTCMLGTDPGPTEQARGTGCANCAPGKFNPHWLVAGGCTTCSAGRYSNTAGAVSCKQCPLGSVVSGIICLQCGVGQYAGRYGATGCSSCDIGKFANQTGSSVCTNCEPGYLSAQVGSDSCTITCNFTTFTLPGDSVCQDCTVGRFADPDSPTVGKCLLCPVGSAQNDTKQLQCNPCAAGTYAPVKGLPDCLLCPVGRSSEKGATICTDCDPGTFNAVPGGTCDACGFGTFSAKTAADSANDCQLCAIGSYADSFGSTACRVCDPGQSTSSPGSTECDFCGAGKFQILDANGNSVCQLCPANTWSEEIGATADANVCFACPEDAPTSLPGASSESKCQPQACAAGLYTDAGEENCASVCPPGSFCLNGVKTQCPPGTYATGSQSVACLPCGLGSSSNVFGSSSKDDCVPCTYGTYSPKAVAAYCRTCSIGNTTLEVGSTSSSDCTPKNGTCVILTPRSKANETTLALTQTNAICLNGIREPIDISQLLPQGRTQLAEYFQYLDDANAFVDVLYQPYFRVAPLRDDAFVDDPPKADKTDGTVTPDDAYTDGNSTADAAFENEGDAEAFSSTRSALDPPSSNSRPSQDIGTGDTSLDYALYIGLIVGILFLALLPVMLYRYFPARIAIFADLFSWAHAVDVSKGRLREPTQFGAAWSWMFICVAAVIALVLASAPNEQVVTSLVPPSASDQQGTALSDWQLTIRMYTGITGMPDWCRPTTYVWYQNSNDGLPPFLSGKQSGFTNSFIFHTQSSGQTCSIAADCYGCGMAGSAYLNFSLPYSAQLLEWQLGVTAAEEARYSSVYGVLSQGAGELADSQTMLTFSTIESYYLDRTTSRPPLTGFEFNYESLTRVQKSRLSSFSSQSSVNVLYQFNKSPVVFQTVISHKLSGAQIAASVLTTISSLLGVFAIIFAIVESEVLKGLFKRTSGRILRDHSGKVIVEDDHGNVISNGKKTTVHPYAPSAAEVEEETTSKPRSTGQLMQEPLNSHAVSSSPKSSSDDVEMMSPSPDHQIRVARDSLTSAEKARANTKSSIIRAERPAEIGGGFSAAGSQPQLAMTADDVEEIDSVQPETSLHKRNL